MKKRVLSFVLLGLLMIAAGCSSKYAESAPQAKYEEEDQVMAETMAVMDQETEAAEGGALGGNSTAVADNRKLITEIRVLMESTMIDDSVKAISDAVKSLGGYYQSSDINGNSVNSQGELRYANLVVRIPQDQLEAFMQVTGNAGNILSRNENIQDVTLQYTDTEAKIKTLEIEQERLWELLSKADNLDSIIILEQRLSDIRYELESYQTQLRTYDDKIDYATIYIDIREVELYTPQSTEGIGQRISKGLQKNVSFLTNAATDILVFLISHLPVLVLLLAAGFIGRKVVIRKWGNKGKGKDSDLPE